MTMPKFLPLIFKQLLRHRTRSGLTLAGVATAMFLFCTVQALQRGVAETTQTTSRDTTLVVYRENRYCPFTSRLPEFYLQRIEKIPGVRSVLPMKIVVNNCRASLDVITYRGVPPERLAEAARQFRFLDGSFEEWKRRSDAALVGETLARRRGFRVGQAINVSGIVNYVAGIVQSDEAQDQNVAYVHLDFLQRASSRGGVGIVTQFNVKVDSPDRLESVARAIDAEFKRDPEPTQTRPEKAFVARAAADVVQIVGFVRWLGWGCLAAVLALVGNAIVLSVQDRIAEHAVFQTLGFRASLIARLIITEGLVIGLAGGAAGTLAVAAFLRWSPLSLSVDGVSVNVAMSFSVVALGLAISAGLGAGAGLVPAWQASRREIAACFRAV